MLISFKVGWLRWHHLRHLIRLWSAPPAGTKSFTQLFFICSMQRYSPTPLKRWSVQSVEFHFKVCLSRLTVVIAHPSRIKTHALLSASITNVTKLLASFHNQFIFNYQTHGQGHNRYAHQICTDEKTNRSLHFHKSLDILSLSFTLANRGWDTNFDCQKRSPHFNNMFESKADRVARSLLKGIHAGSTDWGFHARSSS